jgi:hypothetical protein
MRAAFARIWALADGERVGLLLPGQD